MESARCQRGKTSAGANPFSSPAERAVVRPRHEARAGPAAETSSVTSHRVGATGSMKTWESRGARAIGSRTTRTGLAPAHITNGEFAIVRDDGAHAYDNRIHQRAKAMQVPTILRARDEACVTGARRDEPVQALTELSEHQRGASLDQHAVPFNEIARTRRVPGQQPGPVIAVVDHRYHHASNPRRRPLCQIVL